MNLLNKLFKFKKNKKPTCTDCLKEFLDDEPSLYPKILVGTHRTEQVQNDSSIAWICKDLKHGVEIEKLLNRPQVPIKQQIKDVCKYYEHLMENQLTPAQEKIEADRFVESLVSKLNDLKEQNNDQN